MKSVISILILFVFILAGCSNIKNSHETAPKNLSGSVNRGPVDSEEKAIAIAVNEWNKIYGAKSIAEEKPYNAKLEGDVWIVTGSLPEGYLGGVAEATISKKDGSILEITHGQ